jgi:hypothetical protein
VALDVPLRDGSLIPVASYKITGSYVMMQLPDGRQVAYDVADVDLELLRAWEAAAAAADDGEASAAASTSREALSSGRSLKSTDAAAEQAGDTLTISDRDVRHVRGSGVQGEAEEEEQGDAAGAEAPAGVREGGRVLLTDLRVDPLGEGRWQVEGQVVNRNPKPVMDVVVRLEAGTGEGSEPWSGEVPVASALGPDDSASFSHTFAAEVGEGTAAPAVRARVMWMQQETRREPDYTGAGGVPHPSNVPLAHGSVTGADAVPTPVQ